MINYKIIGDKELVMYLNKAAMKMPEETKRGLSEIGKHLTNEVKNKFGEYQNGWPRLKRATVLAKYKRRRLHGFKRAKLNNKANNILGGDDPLVLYGELHNSIRRKTEKDKVVVYSDNPYSAVHEYGYAPKNIPARSYMRLTLYEEEDEVVNIMNKHIRRVIR